MRYIPREAFDKRAVEKGQVKFYDVAYLQAKPQIKGKTIQIELTNFTTYYTQDDLEELEKMLKKGSSKVVIENGQITKLIKDKKLHFRKGNAHKKLGRLGRLLVG